MQEGTFYKKLNMNAEEVSTCLLLPTQVPEVAPITLHLLLFHVSSLYHCRHSTL
ncbi:hypothetical protein J6590_105203, partial [Homalodisca vitripennis]